MFVSELSEELRVENLAGGQQGNVTYLIVLPHSSIMSCPSSFEELTSVVNVYIAPVSKKDNRHIQFALHLVFVHRVNGLCQLRPQRT